MNILKPLNYAVYMGECVVYELNLNKAGILKNSSKAHLSFQMKFEMTANCKWVSFMGFVFFLIISQDV